MRPAQGSLLDSLGTCKPCSRFIVWMKASWERGRPARTKPGAASANSYTWIDRQRRLGSPSAWPLRFLQRGGCPQSRADAQRPPKGKGCGRDARAPRGNHSVLEGNRRSRASRQRLIRWGTPDGRAGIDILSMINMDRQDKQDGKLLQAKLGQSSGAGLRMPGKQDAGLPKTKSCASCASM